MRLVLIRPACLRWRSPVGVLPGLAAALGGCTSMLEVQTLATGRSDVSAYVLNGGDLDALRREAQRLCPLGGEILRQSGQQQRPEQTDGRWRKAWNATALWIDPPQRSAQLVLVCREPGDKLRLQVSAASAPSRVLTPSAPVVAAMAPPSVPVPNVVQTVVALPVGPLTPEW